MEFAIENGKLIQYEKGKPFNGDGVVTNLTYQPGPPGSGLADVRDQNGYGTDDVPMEFVYQLRAMVDQLCAMAASNSSISCVPNNLPKACTNLEKKDCVMLSVGMKTVKRKRKKKKKKVGITEDDPQENCTECIAQLGEGNEKEALMAEFRTYRSKQQIACEEAENSVKSAMYQLEQAQTRQGQAFSFWKLKTANQVTSRGGRQEKQALKTEVLQAQETYNKATQSVTEWEAKADSITQEAAAKCENVDVQEKLNILLQKLGVAG